MENHHNASRKIATILVAEDESLLREFVSIVLRGQGHNVLLAADGQEALAIWAEKKDEIDLLLTDVVMPNRISGVELARMVRKDKPDLKVIYTSGYSSDLVANDVCEKEGKWFLGKPYPTSRLAELVNTVLKTEIPERNVV